MKHANIPKSPVQFVPAKPPDVEAGEWQPCVNCGKEYKSLVPNQICCSELCAAEYAEETGSR